MIPLAHEAIAEAARRSPEATAVVCRGERLTYSQLLARSSRFAERLRMRGIGPGSLVGIGVERSIDQVSAMLGVWMAGAAYVPLDPEYPASRREAILADAKPAAVLVHARQTAAAGNSPALIVDRDEDVAGEPPMASASRVDDLAYVLYTSGSTGAPKGVMVEHGALAARIAEMRRAFDVGPSDRVSQYPSINWDASLFDTLLALCAGASLHLVAGEARLPGPALAHFLRSERITVSLMPPSVVNALPDVELPDLRFLGLGGEAVPPALVERWTREGRSIVNLYGPTEATVWCTTAYLRAGEDVTIGEPVTGAYVRILDGEREIADGEVGELCMGGAGLARGYFGRPDLTSERFIADPREPAKRLYRTGDLARRRASDGQLEYLGRADRQLKVRGMRIEPAEIEAALMRHDRVRDAVIEADTRDGTRLVAYFVPRRGVPGTARRPDAELRRELRAYLGARLPGPMVPQIFVEMPSLPLTANGKIDRRALPAASDFAIAATAGAPLSGLERVVADAWAHALGLDAVGLHDNFFDLGGHSLLVAQVQTSLAATLGRDIDALALFENPTVASLAARLGATKESVNVPVQDASSRGAARLAARRRRPDAPSFEEAQR